MLGLYQSPVWSYCLPENDAQGVLPHQLQNRQIKHPNSGSSSLGGTGWFQGIWECREAVLDGEGAPLAQNLPDPGLRHFPSLTQGQARCKQAGIEVPRSLQMDKGYKKDVIMIRALALEAAQAVPTLLAPLLPGWGTGHKARPSLPRIRF